MIFCLNQNKKEKQKMKKLMFAAALAAKAMVAQADVTWSWWLDKQSEKTDLSFGVASKCANVNAFELSLLYCGSPVQDGVQFAFLGINDSDKAQVLQLAPWFNRGDDSCVQLAFIANVAKKNTFNLGLVNIADESKVQIGFLNFNKNGFLPVFPFINLDKSLFD